MPCFIRVSAVFASWSGGMFSVWAIWFRLCHVPFWMSSSSWSSLFIESSRRLVRLWSI